MKFWTSTSTKTALQTDKNVPDFSVVLVCWNNREYLEPCLRSLYEGRLRSSFDVVVVDNGSTDGSQEMLLSEFPQVNIIQNNHNVGLGRASNQGIQATSGRHVLLLNNDTIVNGPSLDAMAEFLDTHPEAGAVGGKMLNPDGSFQAADAHFPDHNSPSDIKSVDWVGSACLLLRRAALDEVGLLDEEYFIYGDEADLQYRLKKYGWLVYYLPQATTIHYGGRSMDRWRRRKMVYRGKMLFFRKNYGPLQTGMLRLVFGYLSLAKMVVWGISLVFPNCRERARRELGSNLDVITLCWKLD
jgi:GT2 family glycosyltransferase